MRVLDVLPVDRVQRDLEPARDPRAVAEGGRPRVRLRRLLEEEPQPAAQPLDPRGGRERLVGRVGEDDEPELALAVARELLERPRDLLGGGAQAAREVENHDRVLARGQELRRPAAASARGGRGREARRQTRSARHSHMTRLRGTAAPNAAAPPTGSVEAGAPPACRALRARGRGRPRRRPRSTASSARAPPRARRAPRSCSASGSWRAQAITLLAPARDSSSGPSSSASSSSASRRRSASPCRGGGFELPEDPPQRASRAGARRPEPLEREPQDERRAHERRERRQPEQDVAGQAGRHPVAEAHGVRPTDAEGRAARGRPSRRGRARAGRATATPRAGRPGIRAGSVTRSGLNRKLRTGVTGTHAAPRQRSRSTTSTTSRPPIRWILRVCAAATYGAKDVATRTDSRVDTARIDEHARRRGHGVAEPRIQGRRASASPTTRRTLRVARPADRGDARSPRRSRSRAPARATSAATPATRRRRPLIAAPAAASAARATGGMPRGWLPGPRWRGAPSRARAPRGRAAAPRGAPRFSVRRSIASRRLSRTSSNPPLASVTGSATPDAAGNDCSQRGSCTITGTTSQPRLETISQMRGGGGARKSDSTKTNEPTGRWRLSRTRDRRPVLRLSRGAEPWPVARRYPRIRRACSEPPGGSQRTRRASGMSM